MLCVDSVNPHGCLKSIQISKSLDFGSKLVKCIFFSLLWEACTQMHKSTHPHTNINTWPRARTISITSNWTLRVQFHNLIRFAVSKYPWLNIREELCLCNLCYDTMHYPKPTRLPITGQVISNKTSKPSQYAIIRQLDNSHNLHRTMSLCAFNCMFSLTVNTVCTFRGQGMCFCRNQRKRLFSDWQTGRAYEAQSGRYIYVTNYWSGLCCHSSCQGPPAMAVFRKRPLVKTLCEYWILKARQGRGGVCVYLYVCVCLGGAVWKKRKRATW